LRFFTPPFPPFLELLFSSQRIPLRNRLIFIFHPHASHIPPPQPFLSFFHPLIDAWTWSSIYFALVFALNHGRCRQNLWTAGPHFSPPHLSPLQFSGFSRKFPSSLPKREITPIFLDFFPFFPLCPGSRILPYISLLLFHYIFWSPCSHAGEGVSPFPLSPFTLFCESPFVHFLLADCVLPHSFLKPPPDV